MGKNEKTTFQHIQAENKNSGVIENDHTVSNTAFLTLYGLANSGNDKAELLQSHVDPDLIKDDPHAKNHDRISLLNKVYHRLRYDSLNQFVLKKQHRNVMEIACGYSPRGMELSGAGIHYAGGDFSSVANSMKKLTENYVSADQKKNLDYCEMDCTDRKQMESAAAILEGPVCIVTEGLFMYLNAAQTAIFFDNIHAILQEKRGCFITQDFSTKNFVMDVAEAIYPGDGLKLFLQSVAMYVRAAGSITTRELKENSLKFERSQEQAGLTCQKMRLLDDDYKLDIAGLSSDQRERVNEVFRRKYMSVITVK